MGVSGPLCHDVSPPHGALLSCAGSSEAGLTGDEHLRGSHQRVGHCTNSNKHKNRHGRDQMTE